MRIDTIEKNISTFQVDSKVPEKVDFYRSDGKVPHHHFHRYSCKYLTRNVEVIRSQNYLS